MAINVPVTKGIELDDGKHTGVVTNYELREKPFAYIDLKVKVDGIDAFEMKYSVPARLSKGNKMSKLFAAFGIDAEKIVNENEGKDFDISKLLDIIKGKRVQFMTLKKDKYHEIVDGSLRPL